MTEIEGLIRKYGGVFVAGLFGAIIKRFRKTMSWIRFAATIGTSVFISTITGFLLKEWTNIGELAIFGICGIAGVFSDELLDEIEEIIKEISSYVKSFVNYKTQKKDETE